MRRLALATMFVVTSASAQVAAPVGPDNGFFRPTPGNDPSLTNFLVPVAPQAPQPPQPANSNSPVAGVVALPMPAPVQAMPVVEEQVDRAIREAEEARARAAVVAPAPIVGAFTGQTNERDR